MHCVRWSGAASVSVCDSERRTNEQQMLSTAPKHCANRCDFVMNFVFSLSSPLYKAHANAHNDCLQKQLEHLYDAAIRLHGNDSVMLTHSAARHKKAKHHRMHSESLIKPPRALCTSHNNIPFRSVFCVRSEMTSCSRNC